MEKKDYMLKGLLLTNMPGKNAWEWILWAWEKERGIESWIEELVNIIQDPNTGKDPVDNSIMLDSWKLRKSDQSDGS